MAPESFGDLIARLAKQHELELSEVCKLREENIRLTEELNRLQREDRVGTSTSEQLAEELGSESLSNHSGPKSQTMPLMTVMRKPTPLADTGPSIEEVIERRRSFPDMIPGMPDLLCRPTNAGRRHNTYMADLSEAFRLEQPQEPAATSADTLPRFRQSDSALTQRAARPAEKPPAASKGARTSTTSRRRKSSPPASADLDLHASPVIPQPTDDPSDDESEVLDLPGTLNITEQPAEDPVTKLPTESMMLLRRGSSLVLERTVAEMADRNLVKQKQRFRQVLELPGNEVRPEHIMKVMLKRGVNNYTEEQARTVVLELKEVIQCMEALDPTASTAKEPATDGENSEEEPAVPFDIFVHLMTMPDSLVNSKGEVLVESHIVRKTLLPKGADEVIARVTQSSATAAISDSINTDAMSAIKMNRRMGILNICVGITVVLSMFTLGLSMDVAPNWTGWIALEILFGLVFVCEIFVKIKIIGWTEYWWGPGWKWNWCDTAITLCTMVDVTLSVAMLNHVDGTDITASKLILALRALRLTRIARLVKLLHTPVLSGLANMLAGFMVGVPCMMWVMVLLLIIFYILGMVFRQVVGPSQGTSRIETCNATGDDVSIPSTDLQCQAHQLYGEEFFGSLRMSMFTVFRCVLGDCSSKAGKSLTAAFSAGYGIPFDAVYCGGMVLVVFGLFNIIAAIFVETTISGLKYNNVQRKYARMYESRYVQGKLEALVARIQELHEEKNPHLDSGREFVLTEEEFNEAMQDDSVSILLEDLDIVMTNRVGLFDMFDADNNGLVTVAEVVGTLMKVRGEPQKSDMIASWVALRSLNERFQNFERLIFENQKKMLELQKDMMVVGMPSPANGEASTRVTRRPSGCYTLPTGQAPLLRAQWSGSRE